MRLFWRSLYIIIVALGLVFYLWAYQPSLPFSEKITDLKYRLVQPVDLKVSLSYELDTEKWLNFALERNDEVVKVISNAELPSDYKPAEDERWNYSFEYQMLDDNNQTVLSGTIHHSTGQRIFYDDEKKEQYVASSYFPPTLNPVDARLHLINIRGYKNINKIRLRSESHQLPLIGTVVRVYRQEKIAEHKLSYQWQRMGNHKRTVLAKASVYEQELLRDQEKLLLTQKQWSSLGPLGSNDRDYVLKKLYVARDIEEDSVINLPVIPPEGLVVYPNKKGVIKIPVFPGKVKVSWNLLGPVNDNEKLKIEWWGHPTSRYKKWQRDIKSENIVVQLESGVMQISTNSAAVFRVWILNDKDPVEITPKPINLRLFKVQKNPVVYNINHLQDTNTRIRIDLRKFIDSGSDEVEYRFLNSKGQSVKQGILKLKAEKSAYDTIIADLGRVISNPVSYYFNTTADIKSIELYAGNEVWVSAYTRPADQIRSVTYPFKHEDVTERNNTIPAWYFMRPDNWRKYISDGRSVLLNSQLRPPEVDQMIMAGQYRWDMFLPSGNWRGRELLTRLNDGITYREESLSNRFITIEPNQINTFDLKNLRGEPVISPRLMYLDNKSGEMNIKMWLNNKPYIDQTVYANDGELILPPVEPGRYTIKARTEPQTKILLSHVSGQKSGYVKQLAIKLDKKEKIFTYYKEYDEELMAIRIYTQQKKESSQTIQVNIKGDSDSRLGPFTSWTIKEREYQLDQTDGLEARLLHENQQELGPARLFFIKLGDDLPKEKVYQIKIKLLSGADSFILLTRTLPGVFDKRVIQNEISPH